MAQKKRNVRYGVVGLGHIAQVAVLPAFEHARSSELAALVSGDRKKLRELGRRHGIERLASYEEFDALCASGDLDAVYIALPNHQHREYTERAARAGVHVLCEKPMATTARDGEAMIRACDRAGVKLMIAYRLHFERANLEAIRIVSSGKIGDPRFFSSDFAIDVRAGDIRLRRETGGGTLWDLGVYCINAARGLFRAEPVEVTATTAAHDRERFAEVEEMLSATLKFPGERLAHFVCSFGAASVSTFRVVGTKGSLLLDPAYTYKDGLTHALTIGTKTSSRTFPKRDQFAAELDYFSGCVRDRRDPEPSGKEGLCDVRIVEALYRSARTGRSVAVEIEPRRRRPDLRQEIRRAPVNDPPKPVRTRPPAKG